MGIFDFLKQPSKEKINKSQQLTELGTYRAYFNSFGSDIYQSEIVRSAIRPLVTMTSKAHCRCSNKQLEKLINTRPNIYMNGRAFLQKVRLRYELYNTCMIYVARDDKGKVTSLYPVPYSTFEALEYGDEIFIKFHFTGKVDSLVLPWKDLVVVRKDYNTSDIAGDSNVAILKTLDLINTTNQGVANAVKSTANLRGILKSTKAMLSGDDIRKQKEEFVRDYLGLENEGGIASLDATMEFTPISMNPTVVSDKQIKEFRDNVYRYFGVNDKIVMGDMTSDDLEAFYESRIEPFLCDLSTELEGRVFTERERGFNNWIVYEANKLQFASLTKKIQLFQTVVQYGGMTINEWREGCNLSPIDGGDELIRRLDADVVANQEGENEDGEDGETE